MEKEKTNTLGDIRDDKLYKELKLAYNNAVEQDKESFIFRKKHEFLTKYAKYLLEYVEDVRSRIGLRLYDTDKKKWYVPKKLV